METRTLDYNRLTTAAPPTLSSNFPKRLFDIGFSAAALLILFPLFIGIMCAIRLSSGGSPIYVQHRLGQGGKIFKCYKFRTMYIDADKRLREILKKNPHLNAEWKKKQKLREDPRIFALGKWLRRSSLDELPQFWNVMKGDLSVVGPRPYTLAQKKELGKLAPKILSVKPGITGLWQTSGRSQTTFAQRIVLDAAYVDKRSFYFDLMLVLKTIPQMVFSRDAY